MEWTTAEEYLEVVLSPVHGHGEEWSRLIRHQHDRGDFGGGVIEHIDDFATPEAAVMFAQEFYPDLKVYKWLT